NGTLVSVLREIVGLAVAAAAHVLQHFGRCKVLHRLNACVTKRKLTDTLVPTTEHVPHVLAARIVVLMRRVQRFGERGEVGPLRQPKANDLAAVVPTAQVGNTVRVVGVGPTDGGWRDVLLTRERRVGHAVGYATDTDI